jgi:dihydroorotate dehydrogenase
MIKFRLGMAFAVHTKVARVPEKKMSQINDIASGRDRIIGQMTEALAKRIEGENLPPSLKTSAKEILAESRKSSVRSDEAAEQKVEAKLRRFLFSRGWHEDLVQSGVPHSYDYSKGFDDNAASPPSPSDRPTRTPSASWRLLGQQVGYPIGVAASALTANSRWIQYFAAQGFNVLTYKTVRSTSWQAHPAPNWIFLDNLTRPLAVGSDLHTIEGRGSRTSYPADFATYSMANSFGIPSRRPINWKADIAKTLELLLPGQLLLVSVVGSKTGQELVADFAKVACLAEEAGAKAIELNLSCPNTLGDSGADMRPPISESAAASAEIVTAVRESLRHANTQVVAKLGYMPRPQLAEIVGEIAELIDGISGINSVQAPVLNPDGSAVFKGMEDDPGAPRRLAGISGVAIRDLALDFVSNLASLRRDNGWTFDIIGMGGVMNGHDVRSLMAAGADAVQSATAAANNPALPRTVLFDHSLDSPETEIVGQLHHGLSGSPWQYRTAEGLSRELGMDPLVVQKLLESHPELARRSSLRDRHGQPTWRSPEQPPSRQEKLARLREMFARQ